MPTSRTAAVSALLSAVLLMLTSACGSDDESKSEGGRTITHAYGEAVVQGTPDRVVSVGLREHDALLALGVTPVVVHQWYTEYDSGVGPWAEPLLDGAEPEVIPATQTELDIEWIAAQEPDLIVGMVAAIDEQTYDKLSQIAPTIVRPEKYEDFAVPHDVELSMIGEAVGKPDEAEKLIEETDKTFADARADHPEFDGKSAAVGCPLEDGKLALYSSQDPRGEFLSRLGFTIPKEVDEAADGQYYTEISAENIDLVEDYDLLVLIDDCGESTVDLKDHEIFASLDIAERGDYIYPAPASDAVSHSTVLSIPYALEQLIPPIAEVVAD